ncbi:hypothetical protein [Haliangium ochraceum]|uniref:Outer membrane protein beta-barrel domain-containing protein n=1 Tax=Haliangium ochraceum (strain DSM 14365 / JCM 11303 / SMP-2) TaxID=502025 RepID=D0LP20_HALO1|nr:hypothetical protein [Haliangium ochraceum]ACY18846.1 hypothetical protein Hoch_6376 [Haliangium ochraceum DSM 14365]
MLLAAYLLALANDARADEQEASVYVHALSGVAALDDPAAPDDAKLTPIAGLAARISYAAHDLFAYEVECAISRGAVTSFDDVHWDTVMGEMQRRSYLGRLQTGVRLRLGARYVPTLHVALGVQAHTASQSRLVMAAGGVIDGPGSSTRWAPIASAGLGYEHRIGIHWLAGVSVSATSALTSDVMRSIEGSMHVSYAWYPFW